MCIKLGRSSPTGQSTEDAPANETSLPRLGTAVGLTRAQWPPPRPPPLQPHAQEPVKQLQPRGLPPQRGLPLQRELPPQRGLPQPQPKRQRSATPPFAHPSSSSSSPHSEAGDFPCTQDSQGNVAVPPALLEEPPHDDEARLQEHGDAEATVFSSTGAKQGTFYGLQPTNPCCTANFNAGWPRLAASIFWRTRDGGAAAG